MSMLLSDQNLARVLLQFLLGSYLNHTWFLTIFQPFPASSCYKHVPPQQVGFRKKEYDWSMKVVRQGWI